MTVNWWTLALQAINVAILVWLLGRFLWRPVADMIVQRRDVAQQMLADAEAKRTQADEALQAIEQTRAGFTQERQAMLAAAGAAADREGAIRLAQAEKDAEAIRAAATASLEKERVAAEQAWAERSGRLAVAIAGKLLAGQDGAALRENFTDRLVREVKALPEPVREALASGAAPYEVVSATPLDASEQDRCRTLLAEVLGKEPALTFRPDPALIAGLELHGSDLAVSNSWRAELDRILTDLQHGHERAS